MLPPANSTTGTAQPTPAPILMVDDDVALTELVSEDLMRYGFALDAVHSARKVSKNFATDPMHW